MSFRDPTGDWRPLLELDVGESHVGRTCAAGGRELPLHAHDLARGYCRPVAQARKCRRHRRWSRRVRGAHEVRLRWEVVAGGATVALASAGRALLGRPLVVDLELQLDRATGSAAVDVHRDLRERRHRHAREKLQATAAVAAVRGLHRAGEVQSRGAPFHLRRVYGRTGASVLKDGPGERA